MYSSKLNVNILTALMIQHHVHHVVVCPGSRNSSLVHNFNECPFITCYPVTDERSAGFVALGLTQQIGEVVAVCVTSGSALLNLLPAVAEATYQQEGIVVISADRPAAWINQLDGQTMPQPNALGDFVATSVNLPEPHNDEEHWLCNRLINEAFLKVESNSHPSVHINVPISEPLFEYNVAELPHERVIKCGLWSNDMFQDAVIRAIVEAKRPLFVIGQCGRYTFSEDYLSNLARHFVVLVEPLSSDVLQPSFVDQMLSSIEKHPAAYRPDLVIYMGGNTVSKRLRQFLRSLPDTTRHIVVSPDGELHDISQHTRLVIQGHPGTIVDDINGYLSRTVHPSAFYKKWQELRNEIRKSHEAFQPQFSQMLAVKEFEKLVDREDDIVYYANSSSVRLAALYASHYCFCNRGLNGIEGSLSTAVGASLMTKEDDGLVYCVIGDLSFFYDENALWQQQLTGRLRILLLNNQQGGIFLQLPGLEACPVRDTFIAAKHQLSAEGICKQFNIKYYQAKDEASLQEGLDALLHPESDRPVLLEVLTDPSLDAQEIARYYSNL